MGLEISVPREIMAYQSKVLFGMSWRQLGCAVAGAPIVAGSYALLFYVAQMPTLATYAAVVLCAPPALFGWVRPKGMAFEVWARYWWASFTVDQRALFMSIPRSECEWEEEGRYEHRKKNAWRKARPHEYGR